MVVHNYALKAHGRLPITTRHIRIDTFYMQMETMVSNTHPMEVAVERKIGKSQRAKS